MQEALREERLLRECAEYNANRWKADLEGMTQHRDELLEELRALRFDIDDDWMGG